jgi:hypothetical protein
MKNMIALISKMKAFMVANYQDDDAESRLDVQV